MKIFVVRHSDCDEKGELTGQGRVRAGLLAHSIKPYVNTKPWGRPLVVSSPLKRAMVTTEILLEFLGLQEILKSDLLSRDYEKPEELEPAYQHFTQSGKDKILVSHYPFASLFPVYFARKAWGKNAQVWSIGTAQAAIIDTENKCVIRCV